MPMECCADGVITLTRRGFVIMGKYHALRAQGTGEFGNPVAWIAIAHQEVRSAGVKP